MLNMLQTKARCRSFKRTARKQRAGSDAMPKALCLPIHLDLMVRSHAMDLFTSTASNTMHLYVSGQNSRSDGSYRRDHDADW